MIFLWKPILEVVVVQLLLAGTLSFTIQFRIIDEVAYIVLLKNQHWVFLHNKLKFSFFFLESTSFRHLESALIDCHLLLSSIVIPRNFEIVVEN